MMSAVLLEGTAAAAAAGASTDVILSMSFREWIERWHDFYLMAGTAAVTLAGLLFVALSLHLEQLVKDSHAHLLALGRITLMSFTMVLMISLVMLVPPVSARQTAFMMVGMALAGTIFTVRMTLGAKHHDEAGFTRGQIRKRILFPVIAYLLVAVSGVGVILGIAESLYFMIGAVCMALGNAAGTSWELIVQVARQKQSAAKG